MENESETLLAKKIKNFFTPSVKTKSETLLAKLEHFFSPIVKKEPWYKRTTDHVSTFHQSESRTARPLLSNAFIDSVRRGHLIHEEEKKSKADEIYGEIKKQLRPSLKPVDSTDLLELPKQGSLHIQYDEEGGEISRKRKRLFDDELKQDGSLNFAAGRISGEGANGLGSYESGIADYGVVASGIRANRTDTNGLNVTSGETEDQAVQLPEKFSSQLDKPSTSSEGLTYSDEAMESQEDDTMSDCDIDPSQLLSLSPKVEIKKGSDSLLTYEDDNNESPVKAQVVKMLDKTVQELQKDPPGRQPERSRVLVAEQEASEEKLEESKRLFKKVGSVNQQRSAMDVSPSGWTLTKFSHFFSLQSFSFGDRFFSTLSPRSEDGEFESLRSQLTRDFQTHMVVSGGEMIPVEHPCCLAYLHHKDTKESLVTLFMNHIVSALCFKHGLQVHHEFLLGDKSEGFKISPRCDYALEYQDQLVGVIEVKSPGAMNKNGMVQLMIQMLKIQYMKQSESQRYLGILTDGYKYVIAVLHGDKFLLEEDAAGKVKVHKALKWHDLFAIVNVISEVLGKCLGGSSELEIDSDGDFDLTLD